MVPFLEHVVRHCAQQTTVTVGIAPRRCPSRPHGVQPSPDVRCGPSDSGLLIDRAQALNPLRNKGVQHRGNARWAGCARRRPPRASKRLREDWSGPDRRSRRAMPRSRRRWQRCRSGVDDIGPDHDATDQRADQHQPAAASTGATAPTSTGPCCRLAAPAHDTSMTVAAALVPRTQLHRPAPQDRSASPLPGHAHDRPAQTAPDTTH